MKAKLTIGTRQSLLALWQSNHIAALLREKYPECEVVLKKIVTKGDRILDVPLAQIGGKGLFTKEIETELADGTIDLAVHSLKDMPTVLPEGLCLTAITERANVGDAFVSNKYASFEELPLGAVIGTSSLRRKAQLLAARPDLQIPPDVCLPAVGQGALAIEARTADDEVRSMLEFLNDLPTKQSTDAERAFLGLLEGGCQVPIGVHADVAGEQIKIEAIIAALDGSTVLRDTITGKAEDAVALGQQLGKKMLAAGGQEILAAIL